MDLLKLSTPLPIESIDFRVQSINKGGYATILAYKDARVDMQRLDDVCGALNWKREHSRDNHNCIVSIWDNEKKQWVSKEDTGMEIATEQNKGLANKGLASDSFKRACFNWGIGRELYDYPIIQIKLIQNDKQDAYSEWYLDNGKPKQGYGLKLKEWTWFSQFTDGKLNYLACKDNKGTLRFQFGTYKKENNGQSDK
jgi:hypothetical protein